MKINKKLFVAMLAATAMLVACDDKKKEETGGGDADGIPASCNEYIKAQTACIGKMPEAGRTAMETAMKTTKDSWKTAASTPEGKKALESSCKTMVDAVKSNPACK